MQAKAKNEKTTNPVTPKDKLMADLRLVVTDAEELLRATANQVGEGATVARARIEDSLQIVKEHMLDAEALVTERAGQVAKDTEQYVQDNPWKTIGISAGVGVLIGVLLARR